MGAPKLKKRVLREERETRRRLVFEHIAKVSIVQDLFTGRILGVGVTHDAALKAVEGPVPEGSWEIKEFRVLR